MTARKPLRAVDIFFHRANFHLMGFKFWNENNELQYEIGIFDMACKRIYLDENELLIGGMARSHE